MELSGAYCCMINVEIMFYRVCKLWNRLAENEKKRRNGFYWLLHNEENHKACVSIAERLQVSFNLKENLSVFKHVALRCNLGTVFN